MSVHLSLANSYLPDCVSLGLHGSYPSAMSHPKLLIRFGIVRAPPKPTQKHRLLANSLAQKKMSADDFRRSFVRSWKTVAESVRSKVQGEDEWERCTC